MKIIIWNTYLLRKEIKAKFKAFRNPEYKWWAVESEFGVIEYCKDNWLDIVESEWNIERMDRDDIRIEKAKKRIWLWDKKADKFEKIAEKSDVSKQERDFLSLAEPIKIWHHSEKRHRKLIEKARKKMDQRVKAYDEKENAEDKKEYRENELKRLQDKKEWKRKNADERRKELIEKTKNSISVWSTVYRFWHECIVVKKNEKSAKIKKVNDIEILWSVAYNLLDVG